jgi:hypothetical protein
MDSLPRLTSVLVYFGMHRMLKEWFGLCDRELYSVFARNLYRCVLLNIRAIIIR